MSNFDFQIENINGAVKIGLKGHIDEDVSFSDIKINDAEKIIVNFKEVSSINSCGIREWIKWVQTVSATANIEYEFCPKIIVDQINMVSGFLPNNGKVLSFYVPYYGEDSDNEKMILFTEGKDFTESSVTAPEEIKDESSGETLEIDVIEAKYFKFILSKAS